MFIEGSIGKTILINVQQEFVERIESVLQGAARGKLFYAKLLAADGVGIWIENPNWKTKPMGKPAEAHRLQFFIPWNALNTVGVFPERKFSGALAEEESGAKPIGFHGTDTKD